MLAWVRWISKWLSSTHFDFVFYHDQSLVLNELGAWIISGIKY